MPPKRRRVLAERSIPLSGILATLIGVGLLVGYWNYSGEIAEWAQLEKLAYVSAAVLLGLWGFKRVLASLLWRRTGRSRGSARRRSRLTENRVSLPREGAVFLVMIALLLVGSLIGHSNTLMLLFAMMAGPFVLNGWATFTMLKRMKVSRRAPARAMAGQPVSVDIDLENGKRLFASWLMVVHDRVRNGRESLRPGILFARVPAGESRTASYQLRLAQRGRYRFGPIHVATRFPLGLVERGVVIQEEGEILIYPRLGRLDPRWKQHRLTAAELVQRQDRQQGTYDDDFHRIREYRWGDNPRAIHWRTSARHNELMVCEYRQNRAPRLVILLDLWRPRRPSDEDLERIELAVSLAATLAVEYLREGRNPRLHLIAAGKTLTRWEGRSGPGNLDSLLERLAVVEAGSSPPFTELIEGGAAVRTPGTQTVLVSTRRPEDIPHVPDELTPSRGLGDSGHDLQAVSVNDEKGVSSFFQLD